MSRAIQSVESIGHDLTREQIELIKATIAVEATDNELALFLYTAKRLGLDPLARQIHMVKRQGKMTIQTGIDGYRLIADRTGCYAGNDDPVYSGEVTLNGNAKAPAQATVTVWKFVKGERCPFTATARWTEYCPDGGAAFMWRKLPYLMLGKVAESLALRKAFPAELSGVYTDDEMDQAELNVPAETTRSRSKPTPLLTAPKPPPELSWRGLVQWAENENIPADDIERIFGSSLSEYRKAYPDLTPAQAKQRIIDALWPAPDSINGEDEAEPMPVANITVINPDPISDDLPF